MKNDTIVWPEGKRCAVAVTVNLAAELFWLRLDPACVNMPKTLSMGQYGLHNGLERVLAALDERKIQATFFVPGRVAEMYETRVRDIAARGHELANHGDDYEHMALLEPEEQRRAIARGQEKLKKCAGATPVGFRAPVGELTEETLEAARSLGLVYSSDLSDDDRPYWMDIGKDGTPLLQIPVHWALYDLPYFAFNYTPAFPAGQGRIARYSAVLGNWEDEFDGYYERGLCYVLQVDPQTIGNPGRIAILESILDRVVARGDCWITTCRDIYRHCCS